MSLSGNRGEWSEIYIFLKLMAAGKIYAADSNMKKLANVYLNILKIIREENVGDVYEYYTGNTMKIHLNGKDVGPDTDILKIDKVKKDLWDLFQTTPSGQITSADIENFLDSIHIHKLKAPANSNSNFFGGTEDIVMQISDYRTSIISIVGFSCKSEFSNKSSLFNASKDNTNFRFEIVGNINDTIMNEINNLFNKKNKKDGTIKYDIAVASRIKRMKELGLKIKFDDLIVQNAKRNLVLSGGKEMPSIVACMLESYFWEGNAESVHSSMTEAISYLESKDPANYKNDGFNDLASLYHSKVSKLLYDMFTGMRLSKSWDAKASVTGGYIIVKEDGDVLAYHTTLMDEFKDFLVEKLGFETPSSSRHNAMQIYKNNGKYYINLNLQVRFKG